MSLFRKPDKGACETVMNAIKADPLKFAKYQTLQMVTVAGGRVRVPTAAALKRLGIKVVAFREPVDGEYYIGRHDDVRTDVGCIGKDLWGGCRLVLGPM